MNKHQEVKTIKHKGVDVTVAIDYDNGTASIVEVFRQRQAPYANEYQPKKWVFAGRTLDYMNGWLLILQAMTKAVEQIKKDLEADLAEKSAFKESEIERAMELCGITDIEVKEEVARTGRAIIRKNKK